MPYALRAPAGVVFYTTGDISTSEPTSSLSWPFYGTGPVVPVIFPASLPTTSWYNVGGVFLDVQPVICTAPLPQHGMLLAGSTFFLGFVNPSNLVQELMSDGTTVDLQFLLPQGKPTIATVTLASAQSGTFLSVICTLTTTIFP